MTRLKYLGILIVTGCYTSFILDWPTRLTLFHLNPPSPSLLLLILFPTYEIPNSTSQVRAGNCHSDLFLRIRQSADASHPRAAIPFSAKRPALSSFVRLLGFFLLSPTVAFRSRLLVGGPLLSPIRFLFILWLCPLPFLFLSASAPLTPAFPFPCFIFFSSILSRGASCALLDFVGYDSLYA